VATVVFATRPVRPGHHVAGPGGHHLVAPGASVVLTGPCSGDPTNVVVVRVPGRTGLQRAPAQSMT